MDLQRSGWGGRLAVVLAVTGVTGVATAHGGEAVAPGPSVRLPGETTVDRVVASMEREGDAVPRFVLRSELVLALAVQQRSGEVTLGGNPTADDRTVDAVREVLMGEQMLLREAERAGEGDVDPATFETARARVVTALGGASVRTALLTATGATEDEFSALVRRRVVAERYLVAHAPRLIEPTETDLRQAYRSHQAHPPHQGTVGEGAGDAQGDVPGESFAVARRSLRESLMRAQLPLAVRQYLRGLGSTVRIRVFNAGGALALQEAGGGV